MDVQEDERCYHMALGFRMNPLRTSAGMGFWGAPVVLERRSLR